MNITRYPERFGDYRYRLSVEFTDQDDEYNGGNLVFIMRNPATVLEESDLTDGSPTRRRLIKFARDGRYKAMTEVNLFAYRSADREELLRAARLQGIAVVGPENDQVISEVVQEADKVVVAWGVVADNPLFAERAYQVAERLKGSGKQLYCIGRNGDGSPGNPARGRYVVQRWP